MKCAKLAILSDSEPLWWEKIGKVAKFAKLVIPSDFRPLQWEKVGKVVKCAKLAILSDFEPLQWEKIGKVAKHAKSSETSASTVIWHSDVSNRCGSAIHSRWSIG